jgi:hypothetical protein
MNQNIQQNIPTNKDSSEQPIAPGEDRLSAEKEKIEKEYQRKLLVIQHKEKVAKYIKIIGWSVLGILLAIALVIIALKVVDLFSKQDEEVIPVEVEEDLPPENFSIVTEKITLLQPEKGETSYDVLVQLNNSDPEWGVSRLKYKIILKDRFEKIVGERERISYILPSQEKSIIEVGIATDKVVQTSEVEIELQEIQKLQQDIDFKIEIDKSSFSVAGDKSLVEGTLFNNTPFSFDRVDVAVILFDNNNNVIGLNYTNIGSFVTKTRRSFVAQWPDIVLTGVDRIYIEPSVNVYQSGSFMNTYGTGQVLEY